MKIINNEWSYDVIDESKQVIEACVVFIGNSAASADEKAVKFHPAKIGDDGDLEMLSGSYPNRLQIYMRKIAPLGCVVDNEYYATATVANFAVTALIYYDPTIINSSGQLISDITVYPVVDAILAYQNEFVNVEGYLRDSILQNYIRDVDGVDSFVFTKQEYDANGGVSYSTVSREKLMNQVCQYLNDAAPNLLTYTEIT